MKKKILFITRNLPPLIGGMERLNWHIIDELSKSFIIDIISHYEAEKVKPPSNLFFGIPLNPLPLFLILAFIKTFLASIKQKPDIYYAGSGLTAPIVVFFSKIFKKQSIVYIHGLDIGTENKVYNYLWIPFIRKADVIIANSSSTYDICIKKGIIPSKLKIIHPGVSYPALPKNLDIVNKIKNQYELNNCKILISVGRLTQRKGLNEFIDFCLSEIIKKQPNTKLVIIGDTPNQSLNKKLQSKDLILSTAKKHGIENHIIFTGNISDDKILSSFYYLADIHIFPVKNISEDPEGFGMVAIEAATHGTPTVAFSTGGIIDAIENGKSGFLIEDENYEKLITNIIRILENKSIISTTECINYAEKFAWYNLSKKFNDILEKA
ncbi:glycosyltransferase family 4 protein [Acinetobacter modestus]|uniref:glycosyltransferase family 4 protein n=1 Tax=Acinetobacter modestus TaxID=1776740 RepID=UPI001F4A4C91|nr:glycosyltransferase family 4 protein [Acinetobacter modestus]MCH7332370.1 glycosyltransferase family 4 protein [Acinetobacter modestus]